MSYYCVSSPSDEELAELQDLRQQIILETYDVTIDHSDIWDEGCEVFVVKFKDKVIAGARLVFAGEGSPLPLEADGVCVRDYFKVSDAENYGELSRVVVHPDFRTGEVSLALFSAVESYCRIHKLGKIFFISPSDVARLNGIAIARLNRKSQFHHKLMRAHDFFPPQPLAEKYKGNVHCLGLINIDENCFIYQ